MEAKAWDEALTEGVAQAKNYAGKLAVRFTYSTNGQGIYCIDMLEGSEREVPHYPSPEELWNLTFAEVNAWRDRFAAVPFPDKSGTWQIRFQDKIGRCQNLAPVPPLPYPFLLPRTRGCSPRVSFKRSPTFLPRPSDSRTSTTRERAVSTRPPFASS